MNEELIWKILIISLYSLFSIIRIEYYRRAKKAGYKTVISEKKRYAIWLSVFICYEVFTFFIYILFPEILVWGAFPLPGWARLSGACLGIVAMVLFIWTHQSLGSNHSVRVRIADLQYLVTNGPYRWVGHPMYTAFYLLHIAVILLTANWFIGATWILGLTVIIILRVKTEEAMLLARFGEEYQTYAANTGRFLPRFSFRNGKNA